MVGLARAAMLWASSRGRDGWAAFRPTLRTDLANILRELGDDPQPLIDCGRLQLVSSQSPASAAASVHGDATPWQG
jgi:hypothetical protein